MQQAEPRELSLRALALGAFLVMIMTGANAYIALFAGMTVSPSIPAAVLSVLIFAGLQRAMQNMVKINLLEHNIVQTMASAGEAVAAGYVFTIPALLMSGGYETIPYGMGTIIAAIGGLSGILLMTFLRGTFMKDPTLAYPEGTACAEIIEASEQDDAEGRRSGTIIIQGAIIGALLKFALEGLKLTLPKLKFAFFTKGKSAIAFSSYTSAALLSVGFIVGLNVAILMVIGGSIAWFIAVPMASAGEIFLNGDGDPLSAWDTANMIWDSKIRYLGVGGMLAGGIYTIMRSIPSVLKAINAARIGKGKEDKPRTEQDLSFPKISVVLAILAIGMLILYNQVTDTTTQAIILTLVGLACTGFFVAVSSYIVGLVGSTNNPVSGMIICTLLITAIVTAAVGMTGKEAIVAVMVVAGVVCIAAATGGDTSNDLKTGHILGATPWKQQTAQIIAVIMAALIITPIVNLLHEGYTIGSQALEGPQAGFFSKIGQGFFGDGEIPWDMVWWGLGIGTTFAALDFYLHRSKALFHTHPMAMAIGIYLPFGISVPIFIGAIIAFFVKGKMNGKKMHKRGVNFAAGIIAGEAILGILMAGMVVAKITLVEEGLGSTALTLIGFAMVMYFLRRSAVKE